MRPTLLHRVAAATEFASVLRNGRMADGAMFTHFLETVQKEQDVRTPTSPAPSAQPPLTHPSKWIGEVFGLREWYCSPESAGAFTVARKEDHQLVASGVKMAVGGDGDTHVLPSSVLAVATVDESLSTIRIPLPSPTSTSTCRIEGHSSGVLARIVLTGHPCTVVPFEGQGSVSERVTADVSARRVKSCKEIASILQSLKSVCALHATSASRYDALVLRDPCAQKTIASLACGAYALDAMASYAAFTHEASDASIAKVFAANLLESSARDALELIGTENSGTRTHTANSDISIDYDYVRRVARLAPDVQHLDGWNREVGHAALADLLQAPRNSIQTADMKMAKLPLVGMVLGKQPRLTRLTCPHANLEVVAKAVEQDLGRFVALVAGKPLATRLGGGSGKAHSADSSLLAHYAASFLGEVFAATAAVYRCTAALTVDEEGLGQREWLLAQGFCDLSRERRARILRMLSFEEDCGKISPMLHKKIEFDEIATHPVEAGMVQQPAKGKPQATATTK